MCIKQIIYTSDNKLIMQKKDTNWNWFYYIWIWIRIRIRQQMFKYGEKFIFLIQLAIIKNVLL